MRYGGICANLVHSRNCWRTIDVMHNFSASRKNKTRKSKSLAAFRMPNHHFSFNHHPIPLFTSQIWSGFWMDNDWNDILHP
uniref:Uncharacterized protein n=1 Tax=Acrobeloides nanus TaxID=290746 RepID=A0A914BYE5_9BILA